MHKGIKAILKSNKHDLCSRSYVNYHFPFMSSIMISDTPGQSIRLFHVRSGHKLYSSAPIANLSAPKKGDSTTVDLPVAIHAASRDHVIEVLCGNLEFQRFYKVDHGTNNNFPVNRYAYKSFVIDGQAGFKKIGSEEHIAGERIAMKAGDSTSFASEALRSFTIPSGQIAAWLVYETGEYNSSYQKQCYSNSDLEKLNFDGLYGEMTMEQYNNVLKSIHYMS